MVYRLCSYKLFYKTKKFKYYLLFIISFSIAVLVRPINALFLIFALFTDVNRFDLLKKKILFITIKRQNYKITLFIA